MKAEKEIGLVPIQRIIAIVALTLCCVQSATLFANGYETPPTAYDRFWYRSTYPYRKASRIKVSVPLYAGATVSSHRADSTLSERVGFVGGLGLDFWSGRRAWSLGFDFLIISKGFNSGSDSFFLNFLEIPVLLRVSPFQGFALQLGPYFSPLVLGARQNSGSTSTDVSQNFKSDLGVTVGIRITKRIRYHSHVGLDLRYDYGLSTVNDTLNLKTSAFIAMLMLDFRL